MNQTSVEDRLVKIEEDLKKLTCEEQVSNFMRILIASLTILLWAALAILGFLSTWYNWQSNFLTSVDKVLLPVFQTTIAAALTYIFGKPVATAVARRLSR